uniref:Uncharacterized protein n=1 Tax=Utricularia reniformis TaxID=192314 RepID=A0A1Y0B1Z6_9LAMI|nr:hypothetical protein AEK19_MT1188 [Utricularia reniformis]ART31401.1 hypothetical protein AEK19_MT1188 [Utricularia reniformis]
MNQYASSSMLLCSWGFLYTEKREVLEIFCLHSIGSRFERLGLRCISTLLISSRESVIQVTHQASEKVLFYSNFKDNLVQNITKGRNLPI